MSGAGANITQRVYFICANELSAQHLGLRVRVETRDGAIVTDELIGIHAERGVGDPEHCVLVQLKNTQPRLHDRPWPDRGAYFSIPELGEMTVWEES